MTMTMTITECKPCGTCGTQERYQSGNCVLCSRAATARYRATEHGKKKVAEYIKRSREHRAEYQREYRTNGNGKNVANRYQSGDKRKKVLVQYHRSDKYKNTNLRYRNSTKGKAATKKIKAKRRAMEAKADGSFTQHEWIELCERYNNTCLCCGRDDCDMTVDHVIPLVKGGSNSIENIQPLCLDCNRIKWKDIKDYRVAYGL